MRILIFLMMSVITGVSHGADSSAAQILGAARAFLESFAEQQNSRGYTVNHETGALDDRLSLAPCGPSLEVSFSGDPWQTTQPSLLVACSGERPWRMFLPVTLEIHGQGLVAARPLGRGERITEAALETRSIQLNTTRRSPIRSRDQLIGMEMRRSVNAGTVFTADLLTAPDAVARGDHVVISARTGGFSVRSRGKALSSAGIGEQVLVENLSSARKVRARVTAPGQVEIPM